MSELKPKPTSRDRIYVIALAIVGANLGAWMINAIRLLVANPSSLTLWSYLAADIIAFIGVMWFIRSYRKSRRLKREMEQEEAEDAPQTKEEFLRRPRASASAIREKTYHGRER